MSIPSVILDTNVLVAALSSAEGTSRAVLRGALLGRWRPLISLPLFAEYEDVFSRDETLSRSKLSAAACDELLDALLSVSELVEIYYAWRPNLRDEGDNHVFELAVAAGDAALLTWNLRDFARTELRFPHLRIMTSADWMRRQN
jgi:putative PIN family toxin of toxin-antitoxin system